MRPTPISLSRCLAAALLLGSSSLVGCGPAADEAMGNDAGDAGADSGLGDGAADASLDGGGLDGALPAPDCAPLRAADARAADDEPLEYWPDRLDVVALGPLDVATRAAFEAEGRLECERVHPSGVVFHRLRIAAQPDLAALRARAAELDAAHSTLFVAATLRPTELTAPRADSELAVVAGPGHAIEPTTLAPHQVQGAYEYAAAFHVDVAALAPIEVVVVDRWVDSATFPDELGHIQERTMELLPWLSDADARVVERAISRFDVQHGTEVAGIFVGRDNGVVNPALGPVVTGSGVLSGAGNTTVMASSMVSPGVLSLGFEVLHPDGDVLSVSLLEAAHLIVLAACAHGAVVNNSWGGSPQVRGVLELLLPTERCHDSLFVFAAPNLDERTAANADESTLVLDNVVGVTSVELGSHVHGPGAATGDEFMAGASSAGNSFAAPIVSGAAALVRAIDPSLSPGEVAALLRATAVSNVAGDYVLDAGAAVLGAVAGRSDLAPFSLRQMQQSASVPLGSTPGRTAAFTGTSRSRATWTRTAATLVVARVTDEQNASSPALALDSFEVENGFWSRLESRAAFRPRLSMTDDAVFADREIPTLELVPSGPETHTLFGQHRLVLDAAFSPMSASLTTYCHQITNRRGATSGARLPLALASELGPRAFSVGTSGATVNVYSRTEWYDGTGVPLPAPHSITDCGRDASALPPGNGEAYDAWLDSARDALGFRPTVIERGVTEEIFAAIEISAVTCEASVGAVTAQSVSGDVVTDILRQVLDLSFDWGSPACRANATLTIHQVYRAEATVAGFGTFDLVDVRPMDQPLEFAWDPDERGIGALELLLRVGDSSGALPGVVDPTFATTRHTLFGLGWGMPAVRWAPGIGPVAFVGAGVPAVEVGALERVPR